MPDVLHFRKLEALFAAAPINQALIKEAKIRVKEGFAELSLPIRQEYYHGAMSLHGAIYFKLLDDAAYFAAASMEAQYFMVTKRYQIDFRRPVTGGVLKASGELVSAGESDWLAKSEIVNENGQLVASGQGVFVKSRLKLNDQKGYSS